MRGPISPVRRLYGAHPLHLLLLPASFALFGYVIATLGIEPLWNTKVWWQSILVWFFGAIVLHDLVLFPLYALADRGLRRGLRPRRARPAVPVLNYVRVPALGCVLLLLIYFPGIVEQGQGTYLAATGQTQDPFLGRWLLISGAMFALSVVVYAIRAGVVLRTSNRRVTESVRSPDDEDSRQ